MQQKRPLHLHEQRSLLLQQQRSLLLVLALVEPPPLRFSMLVSVPREGEHGDQDPKQGGHGDQDPKPWEHGDQEPKQGAWRPRSQARLARRPGPPNQESMETRIPQKAAMETRIQQKTCSLFGKRLSIENCRPLTLSLKDLVRTLWRVFGMVWNSRSAFRLYTTSARPCALTCERPCAPQRRKKYTCIYIYIYAYVYLST